MEKVVDRYNELQARLFLGAKGLIQGIGANPKRSPNLVVFLSGVHRSGTNITMRILERSIDTDVFHESDARAFDNYMMRGEGKLRELIGCSNSKRVIFKALHEAHELRNLMIKFSPSKSLWI